MTPSLAFRRLSYGALACSLLWACGPGPEGEPDAARDVDQPFATGLGGDPLHESVTADGLSFLRPEIVTQLQVFNVATDLEFVLDSRYHFDDCNFSGASSTVASEEQAAVAALDPSEVTLESELVALRSFGQALHAAQDFYAHTNWVELGAEGLVDSSLGVFPTLRPYSTLSPSGVVVVEGRVPRGWAVTRAEDAPYPENAVVRARQRKKVQGGLISGSVEYEPGDACPRQVQMSHDELNKDRSTDAAKAAQHARARELATAQTTHEWCRLLTLTREAWGDAGDQRLAAWVDDPAGAYACGEPASLGVVVGTPEPAVATLGSTVEVPIVVTNDGAEATYGTRVVVQLAPGLEVSAVSPAEICEATATGVECYLGQLAAASQAELSVTLTGREVGAQTVSASVTAHATEADASDNESSATVNVEP